MGEKCLLTEIKILWLKKKNSTYSYKVIQSLMTTLQEVAEKMI
jgi:hypothetical protein